MLLAKNYVDETRVFIYTDRGVCCSLVTQINTLREGVVLIRQEVYLRQAFLEQVSVMDVCEYMFCVIFKMQIYGSLLKGWAQNTPVKSINATALYIRSWSWPYEIDNDQLLKREAIVNCKHGQYRVQHFSIHHFLSKSTIVSCYRMLLCGVKLIVLWHLNCMSNRTAIWIEQTLTALPNVLGDILVVLVIIQFCLICSEDLWWRCYFGS